MLRRNNSLMSCKQELVEFSKEDDPWKIPKYSPGEVVQPLTVDNFQDFNSPFSSPEGKNSRKPSRKGSIVADTLRLIQRERKIKIEKKNRMKRLRKTKTMIPTRKKLRIVEGKIDYESAWEIFGMSSPERRKMHKIRKRLNKKIVVVESRKKVNGNRMKVLSLGNGVKKKKSKRLTDFLEGN